MADNISPSSADVIEHGSLNLPELSGRYCVQLSTCAQLDTVTHETTTSGAHRPPTFTVHDYNTTISDFRVTHKDKGRFLKMARK
jgi:hypothetical protein